MWIDCSTDFLENKTPSGVQCTFLLQVASRQEPNQPICSQVVIIFVMPIYATWWRECVSTLLIYQVKALCLPLVDALWITAIFCLSLFFVDKLCLRDNFRVVVLNYSFQTCVNHTAYLPVLPLLSRYPDTAFVFCVFVWQLFHTQALLHSAYSTFWKVSDLIIHQELLEVKENISIYLNLKRGASHTLKGHTLKDNLRIVIVPTFCTPAV